MKKFLSLYPPEAYLDPAVMTTGGVPSYMQPSKEQTKEQIYSDIVSELTNPENANMDEETKYYYILSRGQNPEDFGIYYIPS